MKVIIPMSGYGERFRRAGYDVPKPLIHIDGKPIIEHVVNMFSCEEEFLFICNRKHLDDPSYAMWETLNQICPKRRNYRHRGAPPWTRSRCTVHW